MLVASAVAARTTRIPITVSALLVNLYAPRRLAEDITKVGEPTRLRSGWINGVKDLAVEYGAAR